MRIHCGLYGFFLVILVVVLSGGCTISSKELPKVAHMDQAISKSDLRDGGVTTGGVVVATDVDLKRSVDLPEPAEPFNLLDQCRFWNGELIAAYDDQVGRWPERDFFQLCDFLSRDAVALILQAYADERLIAPEVWKEIESAGLGTRYILLARVDGDDVWRSGRFGMKQDFDFTSQQARSDGLGGVFKESQSETQEVGLRKVKIGRTVTVTLDLFDIAAGCSIAQVSARRSDEETVDSHPADDVATLATATAQVDSLGVEDGSEAETYPEFTPLLQECLEVALRGMIRSELYRKKSVF